MKKYFLVVFLFLQVGFLYAQKASEKLPFKKWEYGLQSNIVLTNRIYVERYLKENLSIKTSLAHEFLPLASFLSIESEFRYYLKKRNKKRTFFNAGISLRTKVLDVFYENPNISHEDYLRNSSAKYLGNNYYFYIPFTYSSNIVGFHLGAGAKKQLTKKWHFEYGIDIHLIYEYIYNEYFSSYRVINTFGFPTFTLRFGWQWNKN